jgi:phosphatidylglycerophosphatase A
MRMAKLLASFFGIGYIQKGAGTVAALFCCLVWYFFDGGALSIWLQVISILTVFFVGVYVSTVVEKEWGHDSNRVVWDELQGMMTALFLVPTDWRYGVVAFILFRFFDIVKPLGIRRMERITSGWGVMLDDFLAGIFSNVLLQLAINSHLLL